MNLEHKTQTKIHRVKRSVRKSQNTVWQIKSKHLPACNDAITKIGCDKVDAIANNLKHLALIVKNGIEIECY